MRNIFDQYSQPENRVTHSLMTAINEDRKLLDLFLHELVKVKAPGDPRKLSVLEQQYPGEDHLTLGIGSQAVDAMLTVPNAVNNNMRKNLVKLGEAVFQALATDIVNNLKPLLDDHEGVTPWGRGIQRRYPAQRAIPYVDARIDFDLPRQFRPVGRPRHSRDGYPPLTAPSPTKKAQTTRFKWAWCFVMSTAPSFGKPMRLI